MAEDSVTSSKINLKKLNVPGGIGRKGSQASTIKSRGPMTSNAKGTGMKGPQPGRKKPVGGMHATLGAFNFSTAKPSMAFSPHHS